MPRNLEPTLIAFPQALQKGAIVVLPTTAPGAGQGSSAGAGSGVPQTLRFQYNPESITRTRTGEWKERKNQKTPSPQQKQKADSLQGGGMFAKSETIALKLVFDATELLLRGGDAGLGVLPELAILERIAIAEPPKDDAKPDPKNQGKLVPILPREVLLVLGPRTFPVIVTSLTITEKRYSPDLVPIRAEADLQMQIMEATEVAGDTAIQSAFQQLMDQRTANAAQADLATDQTALAAALRRSPQGGFP